MNISYPLSKFLSFVLHPLLMPLYATWILFNANSYLSFTTSAPVQKFIYTIIFVSTFLIPSLSAYLLWQTGKIKSLEMPDRKDRYLPFIFTLISFIAGIFLLYKLPINRLFSLLLGGGALTILFSFLINLKWKISIHMTGIGGLLGLLYAHAIYFNAEIILPFTVLAVLAGFLAMARQVLKAHDSSQVYVGFISGFLVQFGFIYFLFEI